MKPAINDNKIVFFTGAGISADSGLETFRSEGGLWDKMNVMDYASITGWQRDPQLVLDFFNDRRNRMLRAQPNKAHLAISALQEKYKVVVITQNIDDLHERAGSQHVIHLHGDIVQGRSSKDKSMRFPLGTSGIALGDTCADGSQIRPNIVWFGEEVEFMEEAKRHLQEAATVVAIGTSLAVQPAAGLLKYARYKARKLLITLDVGTRVPHGFKWMRARASECENLILSL